MLVTRPKLAVHSRVSQHMGKHERAAGGCPALAGAEPLGPSRTRRPAALRRPEAAKLCHAEWASPTGEVRSASGTRWAP
jgi:hypothetical protein